LKFTLEIEMGNEAMRTYADIASATRRIFADFSHRSDVVDDDEGRIYDANGSKVGKWDLSGDPLENEDDEDDEEEDES
jgi:hypothetical protein